MTDYEKAYLREKQLRKRAEQLLEDKSRELYESFESLKQQQKQLISSERMASLGVMAAGIAHEINNPIGFVASNLNNMNESCKDIRSFFKRLQQLLKSSPGNPLAAQIQHALDEHDVDFIVADFKDLSCETEDGLERVKQIIADLKSFVREDDGEMKAVDINDCLRGALNILNNKLKYHAEVDVNYDELPLIQGYYGKLSQVFINLIANADQAISDNGKIIIKTVNSGRNVEVSVTDNGSGIKDEHMEQLFTPFFTTKGVGEGTGLGLSISLGVVEEHGGTIEVNSTPGEGACFTVVLPVG